MAQNYWYLAKAYLKTKQQDAQIIIMIQICFLGIMIATAALALVVSIMTGFELATYKKMQSIYPDLIIATHQANFDPSKLSPLINTSKIGIKAICSERQIQGFLTNCFQTNSPTPITIKGIHPATFDTVIAMSKKLTNPSNSNIADLITGNHVAIGADIAQALSLELGDQALLMTCIAESFNTCFEFESTVVTISGIYKTGISDLDNNTILCDDSWITATMPTAPIDFWYLQLNNSCYDKQIIELIKKIDDCDIYSWKDLFPSLLSALKLEKIVMGLVLLLIVIVASMNIISLISMLIAQKKRDIALLLALGMKITDIQKIFITMSMIIATAGSITGLTVSFLIGLWLDKYPCIKLPDNVYDSDYLPIKLEYATFLLIFIITLLIIYITTLFATKNIKKITVMPHLKN